MSAVDVVHRAYEIWNGQQLDAVGELMGPDSVWDMTRFQGWPEAQAYRGPEGMTQLMRDWFSTWESDEALIDEIVELSSGRVLVVGRLHARGKASGAEVELPYAQIWNVSGGTVTHVDSYTDVDEGRRAAAQETAPAT